MSTTRENAPTSRPVLGKGPKIDNPQGHSARARAYYALRRRSKFARRPVDVTVSTVTTVKVVQPLIHPKPAPQKAGKGRKRASSKRTQSRRKTNKFERQASLPPNRLRVWVPRPSGSGGDVSYVAQHFRSGGVLSTAVKKTRDTPISPEKLKSFGDRINMESALLAIQQAEVQSAIQIASILGSGLDAKNMATNGLWSVIKASYSESGPTVTNRTVDMAINKYIKPSVPYACFHEISLKHKEMWSIIEEVQSNSNIRAKVAAEVFGDGQPSSSGSQPHGVEDSTLKQPSLLTLLEGDSNASDVPIQQLLRVPVADLSARDASRVATWRFENF
jgi:hypothetical protein